MHDTINPFYMTKILNPIIKTAISAMRTLQKYDLWYGGAISQ